MDKQKKKKLLKNIEPCGNFQIVEIWNQYF